MHSAILNIKSKGKFVIKSATIYSHEITQLRVIQKITTFSKISQLIEY